MHIQNNPISYFLFLFFITLLTACEKDSIVIIEDDLPPPIPGDFIIPNITPNGNEKYLNEDSDYIFDQDRLHTFEFWLPKANLAKIDGDPSAEEYVAGTLIFEGDTISPVGIRYKGSVGAWVGCLSGADWANPSGFKTCTKLSMKIKINWEGREEKFFKLKKLQFHSQNLDDSKMRERLGYWLFRQMGVVAPRSVHARLMVNGEYSGVYALTEQIDGRFVKHNFEDDDGNLYKEIWPLRMNGNPYSVNQYKAALKTNEDNNPSVDIMRNFGEAIANASDSELKNVIENSMDINKTLAHIVVDRTIRHDDGPFHWYCGSGNCTNHNYYWYEEPTSKKLHLIPWDLDNAFENIISNANPVTPIADEFGETRNNCQPFGYGFFQIQQWSATCDKLTGGWASYETEYEQLLDQFKNGPFSKENVDSQLDKWKEQIRTAVVEAETSHEDATSVVVWENAVHQLKSQCNFARNK